MKTVSRLAGTVLASLLPLALGACVSSKPVGELAATTARNTALLEANLSALARQQQAISESRIAVISRLRRATVEAEALVGRRQAEEREVGLGAPIDLSERWRRQAEDSAREYTARQELLAAARKELTDKQKAVEAPSAALLDAGKSLLAASEDMTFKQHVAFLFGFASEVGADVKKAQEDAKKAKAAGDAKAKDAESSANANP